MHSDPRHSNAFAFDGDGPTTLGLHWYIHGRPPSCGAESPEAFGLDVSRCRSTARQPHPARAEAAEPFYPVPLFTSNLKYSSLRNSLARYCGSMLCSRAIADHLVRWASMSVANSAGDVPRVMSPTLVKRF